MADEQVSFTSLVLIVVLGGLVIRYLFFPSSATASSGANRTRDSAAISRAREAAVERIQQMFPQFDRRTILWELQRNGGNMATTTERILSGRIDTVSSM
jgi:coupling of ubiquitin conjugation to ER degradation protein 1